MILSRFSLFPGLLKYTIKKDFISAIILRFMCSFLEQRNKKRIMLLNRKKQKTDVDHRDPKLLIFFPGNRLLLRLQL